MILNYVWVCGNTIPRKHKLRAERNTHNSRKRTEERRREEEGRKKEVRSGGWDGEKEKETGKEEEEKSAFYSKGEMFHIIGLIPLGSGAVRSLFFFPTSFIFNFIYLCTGKINTVAQLGQCDSLSAA